MSRTSVDAPRYQQRTVSFVPAVCMDSNCNLSGSNCQVLPGRRPEPLAVGAPIGGNETNVWHIYVKRRALVQFMSHESTKVSRLALAILRTSLDWFIAFGGDLLLHRIGMIASAVILFVGGKVFSLKFCSERVRQPRQHRESPAKQRTEPIRKFFHFTSTVRET